MIRNEKHFVFLAEAAKIIAAVKTKRI